MPLTVVVTESTTHQSFFAPKNRSMKITQRLTYLFCSVTIASVLISCSDTESQSNADANSFENSGATPTVTNSIGNNNNIGNSDGPLDVVIDVPASGPYGVQNIRIPAQTNWVNSGLFLKAGQSAEITAAGLWKVGQNEVGPEGDAQLLGEQRGCPIGSLVARSGLQFEDSLTCIGRSGTFTAIKDDIVYLGMVSSTDLGEAYGERLSLAGEINAQVRSEGDTVPTIRVSALDSVDLSTIASGWVELVSDHIIVTVRIDDLSRDIATAGASLNLLDNVYKQELELRGMAPFSDQRIRFAPNERGGFYMLAGNPIRATRAIFNGANTIRILRAAVDTTDVWGFAHELGHVFSFANGAWTYQTNLESWPNIFTIYALTQLNRTENQPNIDTYCRGRETYLENGNYNELDRDPFLQLCFLMEFTEMYGWAFWTRFFSALNQTTNQTIGFDGTHASAWRFVRDRFSQAAGEDVTTFFNQWRVPLQ